MPVSFIVVSQKNTFVFKPTGKSMLMCSDAVNFIQLSLHSLNPKFLHFSYADLSMYVYNRTFNKHTLEYKGQ